MHSEPAAIYVEACNREHAECALELVHAFDNNEREVSLSQRAVPLNDIDVSCIAEAMRGATHSLRVLNMEGNAFGLPGMQALLEAIEENPGVIREVRLGKNNLKDQAAVIIGHMLARDGCGLKVLDLSENGITKLGVIPIAAALANESCDLVELSFHNNKIEADAATYLGQAIRHARKLKHLHLGYNAIRDAGAAQLAQCIPVTLSLSTLDLTANRIGPSGGQELARALMTSTCNIQRLNLRHNLFDSETIEMYGAVLAANTSLIQLFLGFMNPAPEAAGAVLTALQRNRTLLLLDVYGWKLPTDTAWEILSAVLQNNATVAAIVTDACQPLARRIDGLNDERDARGVHPVYVGPDDRDAYTATKSLRRFSRAQSRRQSRASSRTGSPQDAARQTSARQMSARRSVDSNPRPASVSYRFPQPQPQADTISNHSNPFNTNNHSSMVNHAPPNHSGGGVSGPHAASQAMAGGKAGGLEGVVAELRRTVAALEERVARLERRPECTCGGRRSPERGVYSHRARHAEERSASAYSAHRVSAAELHAPSGARSDMSEPPAEPSALPSERRPPEVALQASTKPKGDYQPHLSPVPARDTNPPRRKGSVMRS